MFDTMTMTKVVGGLCGTLLVFLLGGWAAELVYHSGGHGDEAHAAYVILPEGGETEEVVDEGPSFEEVYAMADAGAGEALWRNCASCHSLEPGENKTGPSLYGVVGRATGTEDGFSYSGSLVAVTETWSPEALDGFLENPRGYAPGTTMSFNGLRKIEDRANLIAYLATQE